MQTNLDASPGERGTLDQPALLEDLTTTHLHTGTARLWGLSLFSLDYRQAYTHTFEEACRFITHYFTVRIPDHPPYTAYRNTDELRLHVRGR